MRLPKGKSGLNHAQSLLARSFLVLLFLAGEPVVAQIQSGTFHTIGLHSGYLYMANRDDLESPMRYSGAALPLMLSYGYHGEINLHSVRLSFHGGSLESVLTSDRGHRIDATGGAIEYSYLHSIEILQEPSFQTFFGVTWNNEAQIRNHIYSTYQGGSWRFFEFYSSLSITGHAEYRISERGSMNARLSMPLVAFVVRPGYADTPLVPEDNTDRSMLKGGRIASWGSFRGFASEVGYNFSLCSHLDLSMRYAVQFTYYALPAATMTFIGQCGVGLLFKL